MARVLVESTEGGVVEDTNGTKLANQVIAWETRAGASITHWSAETGGTSSTAPFTSDSRGRLRLAGAKRWVDAGFYRVAIPDEPGQYFEFDAGGGGAGGTTEYLMNAWQDPEGDWWTPSVDSDGILVTTNSGPGLPPVGVPPYATSAELATTNTRLASVDPTLAPYNADKTGATDCTTALRSARAAALARNVPVVFPPGTYTVSGRIHDAAASGNAVNMVAAVPGTVTIQRTADVPIVEIIGSRGTAVALTANVAAGALTCTTATLPTGLVANDYVHLRSTTIFNGNAVVAEVLRVKSVTGTGPYTITFYGRTEEAYTTAASAVIEKMNFVAGSTISGITFRQTATMRDTSANPLIRLKTTKDDRLTGVTGRDADAPAIENIDCIDWVYRDIFVDNLIDDQVGPPIRLGYGINCGGSSRDGLVENLRARFIRHAFTTNTGAGSLSGCPRHIIVRNAQVSETSSAGLDTHPEGKHVTFEGCHVHQMGAGSDAAGIQTRAPFTSIIDCTIVGCGTGASNIVVQTGATNCLIRGGELIQSGSNTVISVSDNDCTVDGTKITTQGTGYNATLIAAGGQRTTIKNVDCNQGDNTAAAILYGTGTGHILDGGIFRANSEKALFSIPSGATLTVLNRPLRIPNGTTVAPFAGTGIASVVWHDAGYVASVGSYVMTPTDKVVEMTDSSLVRGVNLPPIAGAPIGEVKTIKAGTAGVTTNAITVNRVGGDTFEDATTSRTINTAYGSLKVYSNGTKWMVV